MAGFAEWSITPATAAGLEQLGWHADDPMVRDVVPVVARGGNLVVLLPPVPAWADPIITALVGTAATGRVLVLAAPATVSEWAVAIGAVTESDPIQIDVAREVRGAPARPSSPHSRVLIASPGTALERHARSALHPEEFRTVVFAWPEEWQADDAVAALLQDVPRDAQRVVLTARADLIDGAAGVVERYARKALVITAAADGPAAQAQRETSVRTVPTSWAGRAQTVARVIDRIDRPRVTVWTADTRDHQLIARALGSLPDGVQLATRTIPSDGTIVCYDLPSAQQLAQLAAVGEVFVLVPPGSEQYVRQLAPSRRPMLLDSPATVALEQDALLRQQIAAEIESGDQAAALYALGPLFEQSDPQVVAAAVLGLWRAATSATGSASLQTAKPGRTQAALPGQAIAPAGGTANPGVAKLWIGAGKKDEATVGDFVAVLIKEAGMDRGRIGRIELRDTFALVEVPADEAEGIAQRLVGLTIRKRKLSARVDRGRGGGRDRRP